MGLLSTAARNKSLDNDYGATKGANAAASHVVALFNGDPSLGGTELASTGGYARVTVVNNGTNWPAASSGAKTSAVLTFPTSSAAWSDIATDWVLYDAADGTTAWDSGKLADVVNVTGSGTAVAVKLTIFYNEGA